MKNSNVNGFIILAIARLALIIKSLMSVFLNTGELIKTNNNYRVLQLGYALLKHENS